MSGPMSDLRGPQGRGLAGDRVCIRRVNAVQRCHFVPYLPHSRCASHIRSPPQRGSTHCTARHRSRSPLSGISLHMIATCTLDFHPAILAFCRHDAPFRAEPIHHIKSQPLARASDGRLMLASFGRRPSSRLAQVDWHLVLSLVGFLAHSFYGAQRVAASLGRGCRRLLLVEAVLFVVQKLLDDRHLVQIALQVIHLPFTRVSSTPLVRTSRVSGLRFVWAMPAATWAIYFGACEVRCWVPPNV